MNPEDISKQHSDGLIDAIDTAVKDLSDADGGFRESYVREYLSSSGLGIDQIEMVTWTDRRGTSVTWHGLLRPKTKVFDVDGLPGDWARVVLENFSETWRHPFRADELNYLSGYLHGNLIRILEEVRAAKAARAAEEPKP